MYDRVMDKTNGKKKRDDLAEKESARAISLARGHYRGYVQISRRKQESAPTLKYNARR